ncbi:MAG: UDP-N-acetylmuramoyl-tripeptide--D-alanyl-D-alanine ligase [Clostridia bacterium]|nr:UDP-N-acetylmuramoyl-tripeptide--D-alanyl-D-alanine ligase [Clostridia bacterium]
MEKISISEILSATGGKLLSGNTDTVVESVCIDSREIKNNSLFVPIVGERNDGHDFIKSAFENGAVVSFVQSDHKLSDVYGALVEVESTVSALQDLAKYYRKKFSIPFIGVTGSVGKTTTKEMIAAVLSENLNVLKTQGNYNGQIGLPLTIFNLNKTHQAVILEMGVSKIGEMEKLADIADVDVGVITNIGLSHIENFKEIETTCHEKLKMLKKDSGTYFINGDLPILSKGAEETGKKVITFGINGAYNYRCENISPNDFETNFTLVTDNYKEDIKIPCLGIHNVYNALAAIAIARRMNIHLEDIKKGLAKFKNIAMRQQILNINEVIVIDDSYNASPDSVKSSIRVLRSLNSGGKNIVVVADMLELGERSREIHKELGRYIALEGIDVLITVGKMAKYIHEGAEKANQDIKTIHCRSNKEAYKTLKGIVKPCDKVLVKGSRGMHTDEIVGMMKNEEV